MRYLIYSLFFLLGLNSTHAQSCYEDFLKRGIEAFEAFEFERALNQFEAAKICDDKPSRDTEINNWISKTQNGYIDAIKKERNRARSLALTARSILELQKNNDATKAFRFAQYAQRLDDNPETRAAFYESFYQLGNSDRRNFYIRNIKTFDGFYDGIRSADFIDKNIFYVDSEEKDSIWLYNLEGEQIGMIPSETHHYFRNAYSTETGLILGSEKVDKDHFVMGFQLKNNQLVTEPVFRYQGPQNEVDGLAISPDGSKIVAAFELGDVHVLNPQGQLLYKLQKEESTVYFMDISPDNYLVVAYGNLVKVIKLLPDSYEVAFEQKETALYNPKVSIAPNHELISAAYSGRIRVNHIFGDSMHHEQNFSYKSEVVDFSSNSRYVTVSNKIYDIWNRSYYQEFSQEVRDLKFSTLDKFLMGRIKNDVAGLWIKTYFEYKPFGVLGGHKDELISYGFSPDSSHILTASFDQNIKIWEPTMQANVEVWNIGHLIHPFVVDEQLMIATCDSNDLFLYDAAGTRQLYYGLPVDQVLTMSADGKYLFANQGNGVEVYSFDLKTKKIEFKYGLGGTDPARIASFSPDNKMAVFYSHINGRLGIELWDFNTGNTRYLSGFNDQIYALKWSPDGKRIAAVARDRSLYLWNVENGLNNPVLEKKWRPHPKVGCDNFNFSNDGQNIITCGWDMTSIVWDLEGNPLQRLVGHKFEINDAHYSPDGNYIVTASEDRTAKIWTRNGELIATLNGDGSDVKQARFSDDGRYVITRQGDRTIKIWPFETNLIESYLESFGLPDLTTEEKTKYGID